MQRETRKNNCDSMFANEPFWLNPKKIMLGLFLISFAIWLLVAVQVAGKMEMKFTDLVLKQDGCAELVRQGIHAQPGETADTCKARVQFSHDMLGAGGEVFAGNQSIHIAGSQLLAVRRQPAIQPWTTEQKIWIGFLLALTLSIFLMLLSVVVIFKSNPNELAEAPDHVEISMERVTMAGIEDTRIDEMTHEKFRELIRLGRRSIELRMMDIVLRPRSKTAADDAELDELHALLSKYNELMQERYWYALPSDAANDGDASSI